MTATKTKSAKRGTQTPAAEPRATAEPRVMAAKVTHCSVLLPNGEECARPTIAKGRCWPHYQKLRRGSDRPDSTIREFRKEEVRFGHSRIRTKVYETIERTAAADGTSVYDVVRVLLEEFHSRWLGQEKVAAKIINEHVDRERAQNDQTAVFGGTRIKEPTKLWLEEISKRADVSEYKLVAAIAESWYRKWFPNE